MIPKKVSLLLSIIHQSLFYGGLYLLFLRLSLGPAFPYLTALWILLPVTGTTLFLFKTKKLWQFALLHLLFAIPAFLQITGTFELIFYLLLLMLMTVLHYLDVTSKVSHASSLLPGIWSCIFHAAYYFMALWQKEAVLSTYSVYTFAISVILFLLYRFLEGRENFFLQNQEIAELPEGQIYKVTRTIITIFFSVLIMGMIMVLLSGIGDTLGTFLRYLKNLFLAALQKLFSGTVPEETMENMHTEFFELFPSMETNEANPLMQAIFDILFHIFLFLFGIAILVVLCMGIYRLISQFRNELPEEKDKIEFLSPFVKTEHYQSTKKRSEKPAFFDFSATTQIRKIYQKTIRKKKGREQILSKAYTPSELEQAVSLDSHTLHTLYEKARYSDTGCTSDDLTLLKEQVKS